MNGEDFFKEETLEIIKEIESNSSLNQRVLSEKLNISLGKTNYLLKELAKKGLVKIRSFSKNPRKARKLRYILTPKGLEQKMMLTYYFLKVKEKEFNRLKREYESYMKASNKTDDSKVMEGQNA